MEATVRGYCPPEIQEHLESAFIRAITEPGAPTYCNASASARQAGYSRNRPTSCGQRAWSLLRRPRVRDAIIARFETLQLIGADKRAAELLLERLDRINEQQNSQLTTLATL